MNRLTDPLDTWNGNPEHKECFLYFLVREQLHFTMC